MFTNKDIAYRQLFMVNGLEHRKLKVVDFQLGLYDTEKEQYLTKIPFTKLLALFVVGHTTLTSPLIEKCNKYGIAIVVTKPSFRTVFVHGQIAEANFLLRQQQHLYPKTSTLIAKVLVRSKIENQRILLKRTRLKSTSVQEAIATCTHCLESLEQQSTLQDVLMLEGLAAKQFFQAYYGDLGWTKRSQRTKIDPINATMDIGYTILFNFVECMLRMFGFDLYVGVYHQLWFQRKSLVCDMVEPFRALIDKEIRKNFHYKKFTEKDFDLQQRRYYLKRSETQKYYTIFCEALVENKGEIFAYIRDYYRCFMGRKSVEVYPIFTIK